MLALIKLASFWFPSVPRTAGKQRCNAEGCVLGHHHLLLPQSHLKGYRLPLGFMPTVTLPRSIPQTSQALNKGSWSCFAEVKPRLLKRS